jgi:hypothetical protein
MRSNRPGLAHRLPLEQRSEPAEKASQPHGDPNYYFDKDMADHAIARG